MTDETESKVLSIIANITEKKKPQPEESETENKGTETKPGKSDDKTQTIKGKPKSGKFWKSERKRFSTINKTKGLRPDFAKKKSLRLELQRTKELSRQLQEEFKQKQVEKKEKRRENLKKAEENRRKAEVVQVISNTAKLKRMRKKQMRFIEKRDTNKAIEGNK